MMNKASYHLEIFLFNWHSCLKAFCAWSRWGPRSNKSKYSHQNKVVRQESSKWKNCLSEGRNLDSQ